MVQISAGDKNIRVLMGKCPLENYSEQIRLPFFNALELEIVQAELSGFSVLVKLYVNSKFGPEFIPHDKKQSATV